MALVVGAGRLSSDFKSISNFFEDDYYKNEFNLILNFFQRTYLTKVSSTKLVTPLM